MLRDDLRRHTRSHHERVEAVLDIPGSIRDSNDYVHLLGALFGFYAPLETKLWKHEELLRSLGLSLSDRQKSDKLREDLQSLGLTHRAIDSLALCSSLPALATCRHALGSLYVLEGSTLGAQLIARRLRRDLHPDPPIRFFLGYGERTGAMWRGFVDTLNGITLAAGETAEVLQGAEETFDALERWMTGVSRARA